MSTTIDPDFAEPSVPQTPERKLWATCLLNGIHEAFEARRQRIQRKGATMNFDEAWLFDPEPNHVGSFNWICHQLGMEPELLRERSQRNLPQDVPLDRKAQPRSSKNPRYQSRRCRKFAYRSRSFRSSISPTSKIRFPRCTNWQLSMRRRFLWPN